jgi:quercetin dioxygenase-like cupin family protein
MRESRHLLRAAVVWLPLLSASAALADTAPAPPVVVREIFSGSTTAAGQPILLPQKNARLVVSTYEIAPGARLPVHKHPAPRYAYVIAGTLTVTDAESGEARTYAAGDFIVEMVGRWHYGANTGTEPVKLVVIDQTEGTTANTELRAK